MASVIEAKRRTLETVEIEKRIAALEQREPDRKKTMSALERRITRLKKAGEEAEIDVAAELSARLAEMRAAKRRGDWIEPSYKEKMPAIARGCKGQGPSKPANPPSDLSALTKRGKPMGRRTTIEA